LPGQFGDNLDLSKYQIERIFQFIAGVVPGFVALIIFQLGHPWFFPRFVAWEFLGYKTKVAIAIALAFVVGNSLTRLVAAILSAIGNRVGKAIANRAWEPITNAKPWRDARWRSLVKEQLGHRAPNDTQFVSQANFDRMCEAAIELPEPDKSRTFERLNKARHDALMDDFEWERWYDQYHAAIIQPKDLTIEMYIRNGLDLNLEATAAYIFISALYVPGVRHWWWLVPALAWFVIFLLEGQELLGRFFDRWSTYSDQISYLASLPKPK
jgi:hypothetical protein